MTNLAGMVGSDFTSILIHIYTKIQSMLCTFMYSTCTCIMIQMHDVMFRLRPATTACGCARNPGSTWSHRTATESAEVTKSSSRPRTCRLTPSPAPSACAHVGNYPRTAKFPSQERRNELKTQVSRRKRHEPSDPVASTDSHEKAHSGRED